MKTKIYVYPQAKPHVHDDTDIYKNTVPLSKKGILDHCEIVDPDSAEYFYMGQIGNDHFNLYNENSFQFLKECPQKHICDVEGEGGRSIAPWLHDSIVTSMGPLKKYSNINNLFTRPTFSHLLLDIINNRDPSADFPFPKEKSFGFRGYLNCHSRAMMIYALHQADHFKKELHVNRKWSGPSEIGSAVQLDYIDTMQRNPISLCPRGSGIDSVRLIETCYFQRVPVLISDQDYYLVGEDHYDTSFCFRIVGTDMTPDSMQKGLQNIYDTPIDELEERAHLARKYFDEVIREYFNDPTKYLFDWLRVKDEST